METANTIQGWKINLRNYKAADGKDYDVKASLAALLFHPDQKLTDDESLDNKVLADRIRAAGDEILVDRLDFARLRRAYAAMTGPNEDDLEMFRRIKDETTTQAAAPE